MTRKLFLQIALALVMVFGIVYCGGSEPKPSTSAGGDLETMDVLKLFPKQCTQCHEMRNPKKYDRKTWEFHVNRMHTRASVPQSRVKDIIGLWDREGVDKKVAAWNAAQRAKGKTWSIP